MVTRNAVSGSRVRIPLKGVNNSVKMHGRWLRLTKREGNHGKFPLPFAARRRRKGKTETKERARGVHP